MADYKAHFDQAKKNLAILSNISLKIDKSWDWQVTCAYYTAVHLVNAHIAKKANLHYKTHEKVKNSLFSELSPCKIPDGIYLAYVKLENLSRRARYLCNENPALSVDENASYATHDVHLKKAIILLDTLITYFVQQYNEKFGITDINCIELNNKTLENFRFKQVVFNEK